MILAKFEIFIYLVIFLFIFEISNITQVFINFTIISTIVSFAIISNINLTTGI